MKSVHLIISGRVQGVYFRAYTQKQALKLGINGYVRNKSDGSVEVVACAEEHSLNAFIKWCHKGPIMAKVNHVEINPSLHTEAFSQFEIR